MTTPVGSAAEYRTRENGFSLFFDEALTLPTPYHDKGHYFAKAKDRMDRSFDLIKASVAGSTVLDIGASPFYLLYLAKEYGARRSHGVYFANDAHPLKGTDVVHSKYGPIELSHANIETDGLPLADDSVDVVTACEILEHCEYFPVHLAAEIRRVLRPGGVLCITVPNVCSIANIIKLIFQRNIYMRYRSDPTGRHKHEYTLAEAKTFVLYLGLDVVDAGFLPSPTSDKFWLRPAYQLIAKIPVVKRYSPVIYVVARQLTPKADVALNAFPTALYDPALSIEE